MSGETLHNNTEAAATEQGGRNEYPPFDPKAAEAARVSKAVEIAQDGQKSGLVEDIDKAHAMALAGDYARTKARNLRQEALEHAKKAPESGIHQMKQWEAEWASQGADAAADVLEQRAGEQYDLNDVGRIQDIDKAHAMALAGDYARTKARNLRQEALEHAKKAPESGIHQMKQWEAEWASQGADAAADVLERQASERYDAQHNQ